MGKGEILYGYLEHKQRLK